MAYKLSNWKELFEFCSWKALSKFTLAVCRACRTHAGTFLDEFLWTPWYSVGKRITFKFFYIFFYMNDFIEAVTEKIRWELILFWIGQRISYAAEKQKLSIKTRITTVNLKVAHIPFERLCIIQYMLSAHNASNSTVIYHSSSCGEFSLLVE